MLEQIIAYLKTHLRIEVACDQDYLGTPEVCVKLWLGDDCISESKTTVPEHNHDPNW